MTGLPYTKTEFSPSWLSRLWFRWSRASTAPSTSSTDMFTGPNQASLSEGICLGHPYGEMVPFLHALHIFPSEVQ